MIADATATINSRFFGEGTLKVKTSKLSLAEDLAFRAGHSSIYPLTEIVEAVSGALLGGGYTNGFSYVTELAE